MATIWSAHLPVIQALLAVLFSVLFGESTGQNETFQSTADPTSKGDNWLEIILIGTLTCLIILVVLAIIACLCCHPKRNIRAFSARQVVSSRVSSASHRSLHRNTLDKSLYLASDIKTVPSDEVDTLNRQFMLLKRCSQVKTNTSYTSEPASTGSRATSSLGEGALKGPEIDQAFSTPTNSELRMLTKRSLRPESTVKIIEVTSSVEDRQKLKLLRIK